MSPQRVSVPYPKSAPYPFSWAIRERERERDKRKEKERALASNALEVFFLGPPQTLGSRFFLSFGYPMLFGVPTFLARGSSVSILRLWREERFIVMTSAKTVVVFAAVACGLAAAGVAPNAEKRGRTRFPSLAKQK